MDDQDLRDSLEAPSSAEVLGDDTPIAELSTAPPPAGSSNHIYANPEKWRIGREFLSRYTGTEPEAFQKQIILTTCRLPEWRAWARGCHHVPLRYRRYPAHFGRASVDAASSDEQRSRSG
jgi:hypothetical protein